STRNVVLETQGVYDFFPVGIEHHDLVRPRPKIHQLSGAVCGPAGACGDGKANTCEPHAVWQSWHQFPVQGLRRNRNQNESLRGPHRPGEETPEAERDPAARGITIMLLVRSPGRTTLLRNSNVLVS